MHWSKRAKVALGAATLLPLIGAIAYMALSTLVVRSLPALEQSGRVHPTFAAIQAFGLAMIVWMLAVSAVYIYLVMRFGASTGDRALWLVAVLWAGEKHRTAGLLRTQDLAVVAGAGTC